MDTREKRGETPGPERRRAYVELLWTVMVRKHLRIRRREKTRRYLHGAKGVMPSSSAGLIGCVKAKFRLWIHEHDSDIFVSCKGIRATGIKTHTSTRTNEQETWGCVFGSGLSSPCDSDLLAYLPK